MNKEKALRLRQKILLLLIPNWIWPKSISYQGIEISIRDSGYSTGTKYALWKRVYENDELHFVNEHIKEGDFVLELGASLGIVTRLLSKKVGKSGKVIAVEASKKVFNQEYSKIRLLENVTYINALGIPCNGLNHSKYKNLVFEDGISTLGGKLNYVTTQTSENVIVDLGVLEEGYQRYCLVVDIEGAEQEILNEKASIDPRIKIVIIELHPGIYGAQIENEIKNKLLSQEFKLLDCRNSVFVYRRF